MLVADGITEDNAAHPPRGPIGGSPEPEVQILITDFHIPSVGLRCAGQHQHNVLVGSRLAFPATDRSRAFSTHVLNDWLLNADRPTMGGDKFRYASTVSGE